jgi:putative endonuclease
MAEHNDIGKIGENITQSFLVKHGFMILETNYRTKYGELDIVAKKDKKLHFVEVKSVKVRDFNNLHTLKVKPEDNLTKEKWSKFVISVETYLRHRNVIPASAGGQETLWQIDLACVYIHTEIREGRVVLMQNIHKDQAKGNR